MNNSIKEKVRYWFEFLRLAHVSTDKVVSNNLKSNSDFYAAWGDYKNIKFLEWWKTHSKLFKDAEVLSMPKVGETVRDDAFYVRVPFTYAPSTLGRIVTEMYDRELSKRATRTKKIRKVYGGNYRLSHDDYQVAQFYYYMVFVRDVYLHLRRAEPEAKTGRYIEKSKKVFGNLKRKTTVKREIPFSNKEISYESAARMVRRYKQLAEKLLRNVSEGVFPGDYEETFIKNQTQLRAEKAVKKPVYNSKKFTKGPPKARYQVIKKRVSGTDPYAGIKRKTRSDKGKKRI